ncbi:class I SAM-dependent methyltransferase [Antarctobacter heliothermus]|uniref:Methyltransferase domain-containing protein n=1 Tax=Antarctobacter heliothermus TaxID=74033 RepID=A0A239FYS1_9RHOB|nr:class I SAM-dependent methyltransferase [Antarctobacter heliothermus]SNS62187.1 Methyltransferase domain-containing protein [Antarctobacter heliothermus]
MPTQHAFDAWSAGQSYEHYMGRWIRMISARFVEWLTPKPDADWLDLGCGTGALTQTILTSAAPRSVLAIDQSPDFIAHAKAQTDDRRARFKVADAALLAVDDASVDIVTSALVLNFIPDRQDALAAMSRALRPGGLLSFYVWDYPGGGMGFIDAFWKAAAEVDPKASDLDESTRFPFCTQDVLTRLCQEAGLKRTEVIPIEVTTRFEDFDAFWHPFTMGAGPAPGYCRTLSDAHRQQLKDRLETTLGGDGPVALPARAWAARGYTQAA